MNFQNPSFLWALLLLVIPILIHLFNFRRYKKVIFSNVSMLKEIQTESKKTRQIKKWLVLISRLLAIAVLVFAFAQPYLPNTNGEVGKSLVSIYVDNSQSMNTEGEEGQIFETAKNVARDIVKSLPPETEIQFIDNELSPFSNKLQSVSNAIKLIDDLEITQQSNNLHSVVQKAKSKYASNDYGRLQFFGISDFQNFANEGPINLDSAHKLNLVKLVPEKLQNISVDSVWLTEPLSRPGEPINIRVKIVNNGTENAESSTLILKVNNVQQGVESFSVDAKSQEILDLAFTANTPGWVKGEISINDVPVVFDNNYHFAVHVKPSLKVLQVGVKSPQIAKIFSKDQSFNLQSVISSGINYGDFATYDFIILNQLQEVSSGLAEQVKQFVSNGGVVCVIPNAITPKYSNLFNAVSGISYGGLTMKNLSISPKDLKHPFLKGVYKKIPKNILLPKVIKCFGISGGDAILRLKDGSSILSKVSYKKGSMFCLSVPLNNSFSSLQEHEIFVLMMLKMAFSNSTKQKLSYNLYSTDAITIPAFSNNEESLKLEKGKLSVLLESSGSEGNLKLWLNNYINESGVYSIKRGNDELAKVALNNTRVESKQQFYQSEELAELFTGGQVDVIKFNAASIKNASTLISNGKPLWKLFIFLCLIFLLIEVFLLRFLKS